jgi:hypothetical protein
MSKQIDEISTLLVTRISLSAKDLQNDNTKAEDIGFNRKDALRSVLRGHVATRKVYDTRQDYFPLLNCNIYKIAIGYFFYETYYVPTTLLVESPSVSFELNIFASPKSEIFGFISLSRRMLLGLRSRCTTSNRECLCR